MRALIALSLLIFTIPAAEALETQTQSMSFEACLGVIRNIASQFATAPINIAETNDMRIVRFVTDDGSVLVTCSRPDHKMIVTKSN